MRARRKGCVQEEVWDVITGMVAEKTGETKGKILERIADRADMIQSRKRPSCQRSTNLSGLTPRVLDNVTAKSRT